MKQCLSFAVRLLRCFDSAPPEHPAQFWREGRRLTPHRKPGGLYVFVDTPPGPVTVECPGYQSETVFSADGEVCARFLWPDDRPPPDGWRVVRGKIAPGEVAIWPDESHELRLLAQEREGRALRLRARPGLTGGCLLWRGEGGAWLLRVLDKEPPDLFALDAPLPDGAGSLAVAYAGRAGPDGWCTAFFPDRCALAFDDRWKEE